MSRDIRSFFKASGTKKAPEPASNGPASPVIKRKALVISSDEEDVPPTPKEPAAKSKSHRKKRRISDSDDELPSKGSAGKPDLKKLKAKTDGKEAPPKKAVDIGSVLGSEPVRVERKKPKKASDNVMQFLNDDEDFDTSIAGLDEAQLDGEKQTKNLEEKNVKEATPTKKTPSKIESPQKLILKPPAKSDSPKKASPKKPATPSKDVDVHKREIKKSPLSRLAFDHYSSADEAESSKTSKTEKEKPAKKADTKPTKVEKPKPPKMDDLESSVLSDEDRHDRKRLAAILYQKYKNRQSVINPGSKEVPKGKPNCLAGLTFLVTGILESIEREQANSLIKELGGKVSTTVGKRLNYLVVGEEAGPKKLATAQEMGIKILSEDELFDLIREKSGQVDGNKNKTTPMTTDEKKSKHDSKEDAKRAKHETNHSDAKRKLHDEPKAKVKEEIPSPPKKIKSESKEETKGFVDVKPTASKIDAENLAWVDKYKPTAISQIVGQQGAASNCVKLKNWLSKWHSNHDGKKKLQRPNPWAKNDDGSYYKAALLSGPPGVGKTTTATLVCKELGFDAVEFNASDTRSKKLLKQEVSELLSNKSLYGYFHGDKKAVSKNHVLIMDEVDGMAGNEDRGGIQELIALIKDSSVPIICMCNDRNHQKMRSLVNYCYDLRFNKPRVEQIRGAMMSICFKEGMKLPPGKLDEIIAATNNDIRQTLNHLSLLSAGKELKLNASGDKKDIAKKDLKMGPWEVIRKVFSVDEHKNMSLDDKADLFFHDYSLGPLFVQENYLSVLPKVPKSQIPQQVALAANALSLGDMIDRRIRSNAAWSLLPVQGMFSSVLPGEYMAGHFTGQINFPGWLGKNSKRNKRSRLAQELHDHTRVRTSGSRLSIRMDYAPFLLDAIVRPLREKGLEGVEDALNVIKEYRLLREDLESLIELTTWPGKKNPMDGIDGKVKAALTRAYNKEVMAYSYSAMAGVKKKRAEAQDELGELEEGEEGTTINVGDDEDEDDDKLENDALIKAKKPAEKAAGKADGKKTAVASTSKGKGGASASKTKTGGSRSKK